MNPKSKNKLSNSIIYIFLGIAALFCMAPIILALVNSFKTNGELLTNILALPSQLHFENYSFTFDKMHYLRSLGNTVLLAALSVGMIVIFSSLAGWKLCRTKTRLSRALFSLFVFAMLIPFSSIMMPIYKVVMIFGMKNSLVGLAFIYAGLGVSMAIFLYHGFVKGVPKELEEAAEIDGCSQLQVFFHIIFPLLRPVTMTVCITNVLWIWNDFLLPLIILSDSKQYTLVLSTNMLFGQYGNDWASILSALILAAVPAIVFYAFFQKKILSGISDGALKG